MDHETKEYFHQQIEELGGMIARGFEHVEGEIRELRQDLNSVKLTVERIDRRTQNQIDAVYEEMGVLRTGVKEAQQDIVHLKAQAGLTA